MTELGISTLFKLVQELNAWSPIVVTEFPKLTPVRPVHCKNASLPIVTTELGIVTFTKPVP